ncbi:MAG: ABC transporter ATP-binding protein [Acidimicrobiaceae bacterium]|nr:ABC transporter ATP-binding protein [Acidimicrobiaceae bacterium]MYJ42269.1 ABC transporter ATP-binding protein [Acidimicrobiaceae bacterium]
MALRDGAIRADRGIRRACGHRPGVHSGTALPAVPSRGYTSEGLEVTLPGGAAALNGALLEARHISKRFSGLQAVGGSDGLSFGVDRGAFVGLIGPNGAGKSTTFDLMSGVQTSDTGSVLFDGHDITRSSPDTIAEQGIGRTFQTPRAFESLTVLQNVVAGATSPGESLRWAFGRSWRNHETEIVEAAQAILRRVGLHERAAARVSDLSGGELRMLEVARQLVRDPTVLLLDEPTAGVHPGLQERLAALLQDLHSGGMTLVVVEHNLHFLLALADHILVLADGALLAQGPPADIRADPAVISAYLGGGDAA